MTKAIPASQIVSIIPGVIGAGGNALDLSGLMLTPNPRAPVGVVLQFPSYATVAAYFGATSMEAQKAAVYFSGFDNSSVKPGNLLVYQHNDDSRRSAFIRGGSLAALSLAQLQAISPGALTITIDGTAHTSSSIDLSGATSFSNAASLIQTALGATDAVFTGSIAATTMTVSAVATGVIAAGQYVTGGTITPPCVVGRQLTGPVGGTGTYNIGPTSQTSSSATLTAGAAVVSFDSVSNSFVITAGSIGAITSNIGFGSGGIAPSIALTQATGAILSQGAEVATPAGTMNAVVLATQNFASFTTVQEPSTSDCVAFAAWTSAQNDRYLYICWDTDITATGAPPDTGTAGQLILAANATGTALIWEPTDLFHSDFLMGAIASVGFSFLNGRTNLAFRSQAGLTAGVTDALTAANLILNGYNFYGAYATANQGFTFFYNGSVTGPFLWIDSYIDQIWLNAALQLALMSMLTNFKSVPYNDVGYAFIDAACQDPINAALNFGAIRPGVTLSAAQTAEINAAAGLNIATVIQNRGWYLLVQDATPQVRAARGSPPITLFYTDGQSVNKINLASTEVE